MSPNSSPETAIATHQLVTAGRTSRTARAVGPPSSRGCDRRLARSGRMPAPTSRVPARYTVAASRTAVREAIGTKANGSGAVSGRSSSTQPSGDTQISPCRPSPASATSRTA